MVRMLIPLVLLGLIVLALLLVARTPRRRSGWVEEWADAVPVDDEPPVGNSLADAVERARERLRRAEEEYAARVRSAEEGLARARQDVEVLRVGPVVLGRCTVLVAGREHELTEDTRFRFEQEGQVAYRVDEEGGSTRIVEDDRRSGRLLVVGDGWEEEMHVIPADFAEAERLVAAGEAATRTVAAAQAERTERVERAWSELEEARASRTEVDGARMTLEDLEGSGPRVWDVPEPPEEE